MFKIGTKMMFRTVTHIVTGEVVEVGKKEIAVVNAAWIADTGRFAQAVKSGEFSEVEPYPDGVIVYIGRGAIVDAVAIPSSPRVQK